MDGILLFNKPVLWTSHDAVDFVRKKTGQRSVGHAGTLDPLATGLLLVLIGKATKLSGALTCLDKDYAGVMTLGISTDTQDLEGRIQRFKIPDPLDENRIRSVISELTGTQLQAPPAFSAVRQKGKKLYELARQGQRAWAAPREVVVSEFRITRLDPPDVTFFLSCSKGAYVRSLCDEVGERLGCGATLSALVRTRIGPFHLAHSLTREQVEKLPGDLLERLLLDFEPSKNEALSRNQ